MPHAFAEKPSDTYQAEHLSHPFHEEDPRELVELLGADRACSSGRTTPTSRGCPTRSLRRRMVGLPEEDIRKIMGGNMIDLLGIKVPAGV